MKSCTRCGLQSETPEIHFSKDRAKPDGLASHCRACRKAAQPLAKNPRLTDPTLKRCGACREIFPASPEHFYRCAKRGLYPYCRKCEAARSKARRKTPEMFKSDTHRQCPKCLQIKPAASGFPKNKTHADGVSCYCRECQAAANSRAAKRHRVRRAAAYAAKLKANPKLRVKTRVLGLVRESLKRYAAGAKVGSVSAGFWSAVGYNRDELAKHLERQFLQGMNWSNMSDWHIDHIVPVKCFAVKGFDCAEFRACWALANLRPLWAKDNLSKGATRESLL